MKEPLSIIITSTPEEEECIAEIWADSHFAILAKRDEGVKITIAPHPYNIPRELNFEELLETLILARAKLLVEETT